MSNASAIYEQIESRVQELKESYPFLKKNPNHRVFIALCLKSLFFVDNPENFTEHEITSSIVDSSNDGGIDAILSEDDPDTGVENMVLCQSKYVQSITSEEIKAEIRKMVEFHNSTKIDNISANDDVIQRWKNVNEGTQDSKSKTVFLFVSTASIPADVEKAVRKTFATFCVNDAELRIYAGKRLLEKIREAEATRPLVESGFFDIDDPKNILSYKDIAGHEAIVVNASARSIKNSYDINKTNMLTLNLRHYTKNRKIDESIRTTMEESPEAFWFKNNGLTMVCDEFRVDSEKKRVVLSNFSVVNGGQTTHLIGEYLPHGQDFYVVCKIIKSNSSGDDAKFGLEIAEATNSQKPIKRTDVFANAPEQLEFAIAMQRVGVYYTTKRGILPKESKSFSQPWQKTKMSQVWRLCLAGIFQMPAKARTDADNLLDTEYSRSIFGTERKENIASLTKEFLWLDWFFQNRFINDHCKKLENNDEKHIVPLARVSRTLCVAFTALAARFYSGNINKKDLKFILDNYRDRTKEEEIRIILASIDGSTPLFGKKFSEPNKEYEALVEELFGIAIRRTFDVFNEKLEENSSLIPQNFLKSDDNYYYTLRSRWGILEDDIKRIIGKYQ